MGRSTADLTLGSAVVSLVGNREVAPGLMETVQITVDQLAAVLAPSTIRAVFATRAEMAVSLGYPPNAGAEVHSDTTKPNNGLYRKLGASGTGSWIKVSDLTTAVLSDVVSGLQDALSGQAAALAQQDQRLSARDDLLSSRLAALDGRVADLDRQKAAKSDAVAEASRPGEAPFLFSGSLDGSPAAMPVTTALAVTGAGGRAMAIGSEVLSSIAAHTIEPGRRYRVRVALYRIEDSTAPLPSILRIAVRWLRADHSGLQTQILEDLDWLQVSSGRLEFSYIIGRGPADDIDFAVPDAAVAGRPFIQGFGSARTAVEVLEWQDITSTLDWSPDVSQFTRQVSEFGGALADLSGTLDAVQQTVAGIVQRDEQATFEVIDTDSDRAVVASIGTKTVLHRALMTQPRLLTLSASGASAGARVKVTRLGGGPYALHVLHPEVRTLATNGWAEFVFDGSSWVLCAAGAF